MQAIPLILTGRDIVIHSETGSGKTLAFLLPILKMSQQTPPSADPAVVIIEPTRELASQVLKECAYFMTAPLVHDFSPIQFYDESLDPVWALFRSHLAFLRSGRSISASRSRCVGWRISAGSANGAAEGNRCNREHSWTTDRSNRQETGPLGSHQGIYSR